ncbi:hypothetical protein ACFWPV_38270 [Streptomyces uncialis]
MSRVEKAVRHPLPGERGAVGSGARRGSVRGAAGVTGRRTTVSVR